MVGVTLSLSHDLWLNEKLWLISAKMHVIYWSLFPSLTDSLSHWRYPQVIVTLYYAKHIGALVHSVFLVLGGFAGKECYVETDGTLKILDFYPEDSNKIQYFYLKERVNLKKIR